MSLQQPCWQVVGAAQVELSAQAFTPQLWHVVPMQISPDAQCRSTVQPPAGLQ
jgi:hypothetical protein